MRVLFRPAVAVGAMLIFLMTSASNAMPLSISRRINFETQSEFGICLSRQLDYYANT